MFKQGIGATGESAQVGYLRAETCQPIFVDFDNIRVGARQKVPFGIAQIGKAFRNEINPRNFLFRAREFTQMEMEFFVRPDEVTAAAWRTGCSPGGQCRRRWRGTTTGWRSGANTTSCSASLTTCCACIRTRRRSWRTTPGPPATSSSSSPSAGASWKACTTAASTTCASTRQHSGKRFEYYDDEAEALLIAGGMDKAEARALATYLPVCIETSVGLDRTFLAVLTAAYYEDLQETKHEGKDGGHPPRAAPASAPGPRHLRRLPAEQEALRAGQPAYKLYRELLDAGLNCEFDDAGSIGKRYRRQDEIGTPWCITYDFDSETDGAVTVRDRDSLTQDRVALGAVVSDILARWRG